MEISSSHPSKTFLTKTALCSKYKRPGFHHTCCCIGRAKGWCAQFQTTLFRKTRSYLGFMLHWSHLFQILLLDILKEGICRMYRLHYPLSLKGLLSNLLRQHFCPLYLRSKITGTSCSSWILCCFRHQFPLQFKLRKLDHRTANKVVSLRPFLWGEPVVLCILFFDQTNQERSFLLFPNLSSAHSLLFQAGMSSCISNCEIWSDNM